MAVLLTASVCLSLLRLTDWDCGAAGTAGLAAAACLAAALFRLRWWLFPAAALAVCGGGAAVHAALGDLGPRAARWAGFAAWMFRGMPEDAAFGGAGDILLVRCLLALAVAAAVLPLASRPGLLPLTAALTVCAPLASRWAVRGDISLPLLLWAAGTACALPGFYARWLARRGSGDVSRPRMQLAALPIVLAAAVLSQALVPEDTAAWRSRGLVNLVADCAALFRGPFAAAPAGGTNFSLEDAGFPPEDVLGGSVALSPRRVLSVTSPAPVLLRGRVLDVYTGHSWVAGRHDGDFRWDGLFWRGYRRSAFDLDMPLGGREARRLYGTLTREAEVTVRHETARYTTLFTAGSPSDLAFSRSLRNAEGYFNLRGELYMRLRMPVSQGYTLTARVWNRRDAAFDAAFLALEELAGAREDKRYGDVRARYTALPEGLPESVRAAGRAITEGRETPYEKAAAIADWLAQNCAYTLEPGAVPEGADFTAHFLETRAGYCAYYATALAVLARCADIPSRYVTGYALERAPQGADRYTATGETAHAWAELYFSGIGWVPLDPLAWDAARPLNARDEEEGADPLQDTPRTAEDGARMPEDGAAAERALAEEGADGAEEGGWRGSAAAAAAVLALSAAARLAWVIGMGAKERRYRWNRLARRYPDPAARAEALYGDIVAQLSLLDLAPGPGETLGTYSTRVDRRIVVEEGTMAEVAAVMTAWHFAGRAPEPDDVRGVWRYHGGLEHVLRARLGGAGYFFRRAVARTK